MAVPRSRISHARRDKRRSHHAKKPVSVNNCSNCGSLRMPHRVCSECGFYNAREIVSMDKGE